MASNPPADAPIPTTIRLSFSAVERSGGKGMSGSGFGYCVWLLLKERLINVPGCAEISA